MLNKQVTVTTTPVRVDSGVAGSDISFTPRGDVYLSDRATFAVSDTSFVRFVASGTPFGINAVRETTAERGVWLRTSSGSVVVDVTEDGVNPV